MCAQVIEATNVFFTNERLWRRLNIMFGFKCINFIAAGEVTIFHMKALSL
jgi:hypothetical protein